MIVFQNVFNIIVSLYCTTSTIIFIHCICCTLRYWKVIINHISTNTMITSFVGSSLLNLLNIPYHRDQVRICSFLLFTWKKCMHPFTYQFYTLVSHSLITTQDTSYLKKGRLIHLCISTHVLPIKITKYKQIKSYHPYPL